MTLLGPVLGDLDIFGVPTGNPDLTPFIVLSVAGFVIGVFGHLFRSRTMVAIGVLLVFIGVFLLPLVTYGTSG
jgi:hypothetical protein